MADMNDLLSQANSAVHRSSYQATNRDFGVNEQAISNMTAAPVPSSQIEAMQGAGATPMLDATEWLTAQSERKNKELSLKTVTPKQKAKIMESFKRCRDVAKEQYTSVVEPRVLERRRIYEASPEHYDKVFPKLSETSRFTSKDVKTTIGWLTPSLVEAFTGSDEPISVKGVNIEDDNAAELIQQLVRYQLEKKNDYFQFIFTTTQYALSENFAVAKVWWKREEKRTPMKMMLDLNNEEALLQFIQAATERKIEITKAKPIDDASDFMKVEYEKIEVKANHPVLEYIPTSELRYTPDAARLQDCKFVAHRKIVRGDYLKRREIDGIYENIDKALEEYPAGDTKPTTLDFKNDRDRADQKKRPYDYDNASKEVELYEAYLRVDYNDDGIYENVIVHAVGDEPIRIVENDFEFAPMFVCSAKYDPNAVFAKESFPDEFEQLQDVKTALMRQVITNVAKNNSPRVFVNERNMDMDALMANEEIIPCQGDPSANVMTPPSLPLSSLTMDVIQYCQNELEAQSGSTRYNQGLDSNALNKTATGITAIMGASEKRIKMIARSIAEQFLIPIYKYMILLNQKYLEDEQMIRLTNKSISIRREDLDIDYDLIINVGQGAGTKEAQIQYLMYVLQSIYPQLTSQGIANAKSWYNLVVKLLEALGLRDVSQYLLDPESQEAKEAAAQAQQAAAQQQAEAMQNSLQLAIAKSSVPRVTINTDTMPPDALRQYLNEKLGIETTEREIAETRELAKND